MSGHTPGPWHVAGERGEWVNDSREMNVCRLNATVSVEPDGKVRDDGPKSHGANAHLIAAAPELLDACREALEFLREDLEDGDPSVDDAAMRELMDVGGLLWTAIAKAEGRL